MADPKGRVRILHHPGLGLVFVYLLCELVQHCSTLSNKSDASQPAAETVEEPEVTDAQLDADKQLIYQ